MRAHVSPSLAVAPFKHVSWSTSMRSRTEADIMSRYRTNPLPAPSQLESAPVEKLAYSISQAAEASSLSRSTLYMAMEEGRLRFIKVKARRLILADDLRAFLKGEVA